MKDWPALLFAVALCASPISAKADLLTPDDAKLYRQAFDAARDDHYDWAQAAIGKAHDKLLGKVLLWQYYTSANSGAAFSDIVAFIRTNPTWPQIPTLQRRAEEVITAATPDAMILDWFATSPPQTVDGAMAYGRALINAGQNEKALKLLRDTWINGNFGPVQERQFLDTFQEILRDEDDEARLDRLLWTHQGQAAARQLSRVDDAFRPLAKARLALDDDDANAEALAAGLPDRFRNDPGLLYELLRYRRLHEKDEQAIAVLGHPAADSSHPEAWWVERAILARRALSQGRISQAYDIARHHGHLDGTSFADAEWLAGWIALRFLNDSQVALDHFARMFERVNSAQSRSRAAYWAGRASEALGRSDDVIRWYNLAAMHITTFYGQLAASRLTHDQLWPLPADPEPTPEDRQAFERHELVHVVRMLGEIKETDLVRPFLMRVSELNNSTGVRTLAAGLATTQGRSDIAVSLAKRSEREGIPLITTGYPVPRFTMSDKAEHALVLGVIRQESAFYHQAVSPVGARGLMQLMPATAAKLAKAMNMVFKKKEALANALTEDPGLNVKLGSAYLGDLLGDFNGSYILTVAAYNAGPARVRKWMRDLGDPRQADVDAVDWIETIPFTETRNYVQRVLEGIQVYRRRLGVTDPTLTLDRDVRR